MWRGGRLAAVVVATPEELAAIAERRDERRAVEAGRRATAAAPEVDPTVAALLAHVGLARFADDFAREDINAENIKHVEAADLAGLRRRTTRDASSRRPEIADPRGLPRACGARPSSGAVC